MLFSNSPVKNVVEKLNPYSQRNKISRLKFERKSDYKTFLKFIKDSTKEVEDIKLPDETKKTGLLAAGGLGLGLLTFAAIRGGSGGGLEEGENFTDNALEKAATQIKKITPEVRTKRSISSADDALTDAISRRQSRKIQKKNIKLYQKQQNIKNRFEELYKRYGIKKQTMDKKMDINPRTGEEYTRYDPEIGMAPEDDRVVKDSVDDSFNKPKRKIDKRFKQTTLDEFFGKKEPYDTNKDLKKLIDADLKNPTKIKDKDFKNLSKFIRGDISSEDLDEMIKINRIFDADDDKPLKLFDRKIPLEDRVMYNPNQNRAGSSKLTKVTPPKLNMFDKITKFSNQVLNSGIAKGIFSLSNLLYNPKAFLLYSVLRPTTLADGTLEGKPGVGIYDSENYFFDEDTAVNIFDFSEGRESAIPFDANIKEPLVSQPSNLQAPKNDIFIDFEFNTTEDLFFMKMGGS